MFCESSPHGAKFVSTLSPEQMIVSFRFLALRFYGSTDQPTYWPTNQPISVSTNRRQIANNKLYDTYYWKTQIR